MSWSLHRRHAFAKNSWRVTLGPGRGRLLPAYSVMLVGRCGLADELRRTIESTGACTAVTQAPPGYDPGHLIVRRRPDFAIFVGGGGGRALGTVMDTVTASFAPPTTRLVRIQKDDGLLLVESLSPLLPSEKRSLSALCGPLLDFHHAV